MKRVALSVVLILPCLFLGRPIACDAGHTIEFLVPGSAILTSRQLSVDLGRASEGDGESAERVGRHYAAVNQPNLALSWLRIAAIKGRASAQHVFYMVAVSLHDLDKAGQCEAILWLNEACKRYEPARDTRSSTMKIQNGSLKGIFWK